VTPTTCVLSFEDAHPDDWFYQYVRYLFCRGVVGGYYTIPPCSQPGATCFKPANTTTRGQITKIVALAFNLPINTQGGPHFSDVMPGSTFYDYIETGYNLGILGGYPDGTFRPSYEVSRGQITRIVVNAAIATDPVHWALSDPSTSTFEDVPAGSTYFRYVETAAAHGVVSGYPCGTLPAGQCVPPLNKPYFVPSGNATRAQISKITYIAATYGR
jgi:N-acetylmuramoyl-L-alanine amidase